MKDRNITIFISCLSLLFLGIVALAQESMPILPIVIQGRVLINDVPAPDNSSVEARIGETTVKTALVIDGQYIMAIKGDANTAGKEITFYIDGIKTNATTTWAPGKVEEIDLSVKKENVANLWIFGVIALFILVFATLRWRKKNKHQKR